MAKLRLAMSLLKILVYGVNVDMGFDKDNPAVVGNATKVDDYDVVHDNANYLQQFISDGVAFDDADDTPDGHGHTGSPDGRLIVTAALTDNNVTNAKLENIHKKFVFNGAQTKIFDLASDETFDVTLSTGLYWQNKIVRIDAHVVIYGSDYSASGAPFDWTPRMGDLMSPSAQDPQDVPGNPNAEQWWENSEDHFDAFTLDAVANIRTLREYEIQKPASSLDTYRTQLYTSVTHTLVLRFWRDIAGAAPYYGDDAYAKWQIVVELLEDGVAHN
jgi:hypothetical protein